jgi:hypothetical protein
MRRKHGELNKKVHRFLMIALLFWIQINIIGQDAVKIKGLLFLLGDGMLQESAWESLDFFPDHAQAKFRALQKSEVRIGYDNEFLGGCQSLYAGCIENIHSHKRDEL